GCADGGRHRVLRARRVPGSRARRNRTGDGTAATAAVAAPASPAPEGDRIVPVGLPTGALLRRHPPGPTGGLVDEHQGGHRPGGRPVGAGDLVADVDAGAAEVRDPQLHLVGPQRVGQRREVLDLLAGDVGVRARAETGGEDLRAGHLATTPATLAVVPGPLPR